MIGLKTLNKNQLVFGFSEVVKHALIADKDFWNHLTKTELKDLIWEDVIAHSISIKNKINSFTAVTAQSKVYSIKKSKI